MDILVGRKYNAATTISGIGLRAAGTANLKDSPTLAAGDVKVSKDDGATWTNVGTLPTFNGTAGKAVLSAAEVQAAHTILRFVDQTTPKEWDDLQIVVFTFGHASAAYPTDYSGGAAGPLITSGTGADQVNPSAGNVRLASDGLDNIPPTAPTGMATTFREMVVALWRRHFKKVVKDNAGNTIKTYADDGTTVITTQNISDTGTAETLGAGS